MLRASNETHIHPKINFISIIRSDLDVVEIAAYCTTEKIFSFGLVRIKVQNQFLISVNILLSEEMHVLEFFNLS